MNENYNCIISVSDLQLKLNLGVPEEERKTPQDVLVHLKLYFKNPPEGCMNDDIKDTICYFDIYQLIEKYCHNKEFKLLEYLTFQLYKQIRAIVDENIKIWIKIDKCKPPFNGSSSFEYSDI